LQGLFSTHFEQYNVVDTAECKCCRKSDEKLLKVKSYQKCKTLLLQHSVTQPSATETVVRYSSRAADANGKQKIVYH